jgi:hypothetical protein
MSDGVAWSLGFARQAQADFRLYQVLEANQSVATCHRLQFLHMACEKLVKAFLCNVGEDPLRLQTGHAYVRVHLPTVLRQAATFVNFPSCVPFLHSAQEGRLEKVVRS